jgi:hypothetical protein
VNTAIIPQALKLLPVFLRWHFASRPLFIVKSYGAYASALAGVFSFAYLLRTLFSPWKAIADAYPSKGFNLAEIGSVFALNMTARGVGAVIRLGTIVVGIIAQAACAVCFAAYLAAWIAFPVLLPVSMITFFTTVI